LHARWFWRMLYANDSQTMRESREFTKPASAASRLPFEHYRRGVLASERRAIARNCGKRAPRTGWPEPDIRVGEEYFARPRLPISALPWYARGQKKITIESGTVFATGVCRLLPCQPDHAEEVFISLQEALKKNVAPQRTCRKSEDMAIARARRTRSLAAQAIFAARSSWIPTKTNIHFIWDPELRPMTPPTRRDTPPKLEEREQDNPEDRACLILSLEKAGRKTEDDQERDGGQRSFWPNGIPAIVAMRNRSWPGAIASRTELDVKALRAEMIGRRRLQRGRFRFFERHYRTHIRRGGRKSPRPTRCRGERISRCSAADQGSARSTAGRGN